jgi:hypothetical protein
MKLNQTLNKKLVEIVAKRVLDRARDPKAKFATGPASGHEGVNKSSLRQ